MVNVNILGSSSEPCGTPACRNPEERTLCSTASWRTNYSAGEPSAEPCGTPEEKKKTFLKTFQNLNAVKKYELLFLADILFFLK